MLYYLIVGIVPLLLFIIALMKILAMYSMISYQQKMIVAGIFYLITGVVTLLLLPDKSIYYFLFFVAFTIHFLGILFIETRFSKINQLALLSFSM